MKELTICEPLLHGGIFEHCWLSETSSRKICIGIDALEGSMPFAMKAIMPRSLHCGFMRFQRLRLILIPINQVLSSERSTFIAEQNEHDVVSLVVSYTIISIHMYATRKRGNGGGLHSMIEIFGRWIPTTDGADPTSTLWRMGPSPFRWPEPGRGGCSWGCAGGVFGSCYRCCCAASHSTGADSQAHPRWMSVEKDVSWVLRLINDSDFRDRAKKWVAFPLVIKITCLTCLKCFVFKPIDLQKVMRRQWD